MRTIRQHGLGVVRGVAWLTRYSRHGFDEGFESVHVMAVAPAACAANGTPVLLVIR